MRSKYLNTAQMTADSISDLYARKSSMSMAYIGLDENTRDEINEELQKLFQDVSKGNLDFVTDTLSSHTMILNNIMKVSLQKANGSDYAREYMQISIKAMEQARKTGVALAQIKNVVLNIENLIIQQNNLVQINSADKSKSVSKAVEIKNELD